MMVMVVRIMRKRPAAVSMKPNKSANHMEVEWNAE
jgi:hypothetical protein